MLITSSPQSNLICFHLLSYLLVMKFLQLLLSQCLWKEYTADNGKIYYHNVNTKESRWVVPPELEEIKKKIAAEE